MDILRDRENALETKFGKLGFRVENNRKEDSLMFARIHDELDANSNLKKENKIVITVLTSKTPMQQAIWVRRNWCVGVSVCGCVVVWVSVCVCVCVWVFNSIVPESAKNILFIDLGIRIPGKFHLQK
jgi:hypothetical protein